MPKFDTGLVRTDNIALQKIDLPEISLGDKVIGYNYHKDMEAIFQAAKEKKDRAKLAWL